MDFPSQSDIKLGGSIYSDRDHILTVSNCVFESNKTLSGGAIFYMGRDDNYDYNKRKISITESKFINNKAYAEGDTLQHLALDDARQLEYSEQYNPYYFTYPQFPIEKNILVHAGMGGAIAATHFCLNITQTLFQQNHAFINGGALYFECKGSPDYSQQQPSQVPSQVNLTSVVFSNNLQQNDMSLSHSPSEGGGAISIVTLAPDSIDIGLDNCKFSNNIAASNNGHIILRYDILQNVNSEPSRH